MTNYFIKLNKNKGFTLIELLVVVAIIGILASVILTSLNSTRAKARDAKRVTELNQIRTALELYHSDNLNYPQYTTGSVTCSGGWAISHPSYITCWEDLKTKLLPYIKDLPQDPLNNYPPTAAVEGYDYRSENGTNFCLLAQMEVNDPAKDEGCYGGAWYCIGSNGASSCN